MAHKLVFSIIAGVVVIGVGTGLYFGLSNKDDNNSDNLTTSTNSDTNSDFQRTGQYSFGVDVCNEMTSGEVADVIQKTIQKTEDYSNSDSTGCKYFVSNTSFVIIDVGYGDMATQRTGLLALDRTIKSDNRITLENMLAYSESGLVDVYMDVAPGQKYVRVGRSSVSAVDEETLIKLAIATEAKIRSFR